MFTRTRHLGFGLGDIVPSAWANQLDAAHANAIDGVGGGTYGGNLDLSGVLKFDNLTVSSPNHYKLGKRTVERVYTGGLLIDEGVDKFFPVLVLGSTPVRRLNVTLIVPHGATIKKIAARIAPAVIGTYPTTFPSISLSKTIYSTNASVTVADFVFDNKRLTYYETPHDVELSDLSATVDRADETYVVNIRGAGGTGFDVSLLGLKVTYETSAMDDGY